MRRTAKLSNVALALITVQFLSGCASVTTENNGDPYEGFNRKVFAFNMTLDRYAIKPAAKGYRWLLPTYARDRIRNFLNNLTEPLVFVNDVLQVRVSAAGATFSRFVINTIFGLGGLYDVVGESGLVRQSGDFGQTLYVWGLGNGPYVMLPVLGPSNVRDAVGLGVDFYANPIGHISTSGDWQWVNFGIGTLRGIDLREQNIESLDTLESNSLDFYATLRSVYQQRRRAQLEEARPSGEPDPGLTDPGADSLSDPGPTPVRPPAGTPAH